MSETAPLTFRGQAWARWCLQRLGWTLLEADLPGPRGIIVAYPHTSNWDFPIAMLTKWALGWPLRFWVKDSLFRWPLFGSWLRWIGGVPVRRDSPQGLVQETVAAMQAAPFFWLALAPEGTRALTPGWRMGFYHLWVASGYPLAIGVMDWANKTIGVKSFLNASGDVEQDFLRIAAEVGEVRGHTPDNGSPIAPWQRPAPEQEGTTHE